MFSKIYSIISPFVFGAVMAFVFNVPMRAIENTMVKIKSEKTRRILAVLITLLVVSLVFVLVLYLLIPQLVETARSLVPKMKEFAVVAENKAESVFADNPQIKDWIDNNGLIDGLIKTLGDVLSRVLTKTVNAIGNITSVLMNVVISLVFAVYCLCQKETLARQGRKILYAFLPEKVVDRIVSILRLTNVTFSNFLSGQCIEVCILGSMFAISMAIMKMPYIPLVSVLIAVTAFIPVVGAWVGCVCGTFLILVANPVQAIAFVIMFVVLQQIENNIIYPRVVGTSIGLSGMWVLVAVAVGGELLGVVGMFLMIPLAAVIQSLLREAINDKLSEKSISAEKLVAQPPELRDSFWVRIMGTKKKTEADSKNSENAEPEIKE